MKALLIRVVCITVLTGCMSTYVSGQRGEASSLHLWKSDSKENHFEKGRDGIKAPSFGAIPFTMHNAHDSSDSSYSDATSLNARTQGSIGATILTDVGVHYEFLPANQGAAIRLVFNYGVLVDFSTNDAIGLCYSLYDVFYSDFSWDEGFSSGPELRYRHWLDSEKSLDFGIGPMFRNTAFVSLSGLVKWNVAPSFGIAIRPELRRTRSNSNLGNKKQDDPYRFRLAAGVELGSTPSLVLHAIAVGVFLILFAFSGGP